MYARLLLCSTVLLWAPALSACQTSPPAARSTVTGLSDRFVNASPDDVVVVAHRGCWNDAPENSIAAIEACIALGVPVVELDVRSTADGVLVLMHDDSIDRTTNGSGAIADITYAELGELYLKTRKGGVDGMLTSQRVPTFEEAMLAARGRILVNLDAKEDIHQAAFDVLEETGTVDHIIMKRRLSPGDPILDRTPPFDRVLTMPVIFQSDDPGLVATREQLAGDPDAVEVIFSDLGYGMDAASAITEWGKPAWVNSLGSWSAAGLYDAPAMTDPDGNWGRLIDAGYSIIQTDEPEALLRYLSRRSAEQDR